MFLHKIESVKTGIFINPRHIQSYVDWFYLRWSSSVTESKRLSVGNRGVTSKSLLYSPLMYTRATSYNKNIICHVRKIDQMTKPKSKHSILIPLLVNNQQLKLKQGWCQNDLTYFDPQLIDTINNKSIFIHLLSVPAKKLAAENYKHVWFYVARREVMWPDTLSLCLCTCTYNISTAAYSYTERVFISRRIRNSNLYFSYAKTEKLSSS